MENTAHSYTEAAEYNPEDAPQKPIKPQKPHSLQKFYMEYLDVTMALNKILELYEREATGVEKFSTEEWTNAIENGRKALENAIN